MKTTSNEVLRSDLKRFHDELTALIKRPEFTSSSIASSYAEGIKEEAKKLAAPDVPNDQLADNAKILKQSKELLEMALNNQVNKEDIVTPLSTVNHLLKIQSEAIQQLESAPPVMEPSTQSDAKAPTSTAETNSTPTPAKGIKPQSAGQAFSSSMSSSMSSRLKQGRRELENKSFPMGPLYKALFAAIETAIKNRRAEKVEAAKAAREAAETQAASVTTVTPETPPTSTEATAETAEMSQVEELEETAPSTEPTAAATEPVTTTTLETPPTTAEADAETAETSQVEGVEEPAPFTEPMAAATTTATTTTPEKPATAAATPVTETITNKHGSVNITKTAGKPDSLSSNSPKALMSAVADKGYKSFTINSGSPEKALACMKEGAAAGVPHVAVSKEMEDKIMANPKLAEQYKVEKAKQDKKLAELKQNKRTNTLTGEASQPGPKPLPTAPQEQEEEIQAPTEQAPEAPTSKSATTETDTTATTSTNKISKAPSTPAPEPPKNAAQPTPEPAEKPEPPPWTGTSNADVHQAPEEQKPEVLHKQMSTKEMSPQQFKNLSETMGPEKSTQLLASTASLEPPQPPQTAQNDQQEDQQQSIKAAQATKAQSMSNALGTLTNQEMDSFTQQVQQQAMEKIENGQPADTEIETLRQAQEKLIDEETNGNSSRPSDPDTRSSSTTDISNNSNSSQNNNQSNTTSANATSNQSSSNDPKNQSSNNPPSNTTSSNDSNKSSGSNTKPSFGSASVGQLANDLKEAQENLSDRIERTRSINRPK